jgi:hypothetical protein
MEPYILAALLNQHDQFAPLFLAIPKRNQLHYPFFFSNLALANLFALADCLD